MEIDEKKSLAHELTKILIQNNNVTPVSDGYNNLKFEIDDELFSYLELCHYFLIEIEKFENL